VLDMLCRLTAAESTQGTQDPAPQQQSAELARTARSSLKKAWLAYVEEHGHRKPDRGQHTIASAGTCADFFYDDYQLAVFIDDPHHDGHSQRAKDEDIDVRLAEQGYIVVRFHKETKGWPDIFGKHADLFGAGTSKALT
jgi:very-short-patch-repair endonuclease